MAPSNSSTKEKGTASSHPKTVEKDVFLHISNFIGGSMGDVPINGITVAYQVGRTKSGKEEAWNVERAAATSKIGDSVFGTVKWFNWDDGKLYGFVKVPGLSKDVFLHVNDLTGLADDEKILIGEGADLVFVLQESRKGYVAKHASLAETSKVVPIKRA